VSNDVLHEVERRCMQYGDDATNITQLKKLVAQLIADRDWQKFHSPKNVAVKISVEAAELLEKFVWIQDHESFAIVDTNRQEVENELADVFFLMLSFCNVAKIDLASALITKMEEISNKYPIEKSKGLCTKYTKL
jgi:dCTP diphosphatase